MYFTREYAKGVKSFSPGLRGTSYPGISTEEATNSNGVASRTTCESGCNSVGVERYLDFDPGLLVPRNPGLKDETPSALIPSGA
jgi:hypothetical protein